MTGRILAWLMASIATAPAVPSQSASPSPHNECVVMLHGMGRTRLSMNKLADALAQEGFETVNYDYPSTSISIEEISERHVDEAIGRCELERPERIHFVTHSLGGIVVRHYLQTQSLPEGSRVLMLSPPNQGSEVVDTMKDFFAYKWTTGTPGQQLGTGRDGLPAKLQLLDVEVGIITGNRSLEPWFSTVLPGEDDGKVSVESARLPEMKDFLVVESGHTFIMRNPVVIAQVSHFLRHGRFDRSTDVSATLPPGASRTAAGWKRSTPTASSMNEPGPSPSMSSCRSGSVDGRNGELSDFCFPEAS